MDHYAPSTAPAMAVPSSSNRAYANQNCITDNNTDEKTEGGTRGRENVGWSDLNFSTYAVYGSAWIFTVDTMLFPLEVMKTRIMAERGSPQQPARLSQMLSTVIRQEGFLKLFRGMTPSVMGSFPGQATYYTTYEISSHKVKQLLPEGWRDDADPLSGFVIHSTAGAMAEIFAGTFYVPADIVSQRLQVQGLETSKNYSGARDVIRSTMAKEGIRGFYRGYSAYIMAYAPGSAIYWGGYESFKKTWFAAFSAVERYASDSRSSKSQNATLLSRELTTGYVHALSGACAGFCSCVANNPLDMMRTRIQLLEPGRDEKDFALLKRGYWYFAAKIAREEGFKAFYRGLKPRLVVAIPGSVLALSGYEAIKSWSMTKVQLCPLGEDPPPLHRVTG